MVTPGALAALAVGVAVGLVTIKGTFGICKKWTRLVNLIIGALAVAADY